MHLHPTVRTAHPGRLCLPRVVLCGLAFSGLGASAAAQQAPVRVTPAQFRSLAWLEGRWRGQAEGGKPFYESYVFVDDSTLASRTFPDSTFAAPSDSSEIRLRGSELVSQSGKKRWVAALLDTAHVRFAPVAGARNSFTWRRKSADVWVATLRWPTRFSRRPRTLVYRMERVAEPPGRSP